MIVDKSDLFLLNVPFYPLTSVSASRSENRSVCCSGSYSLWQGCPQRRHRMMSFAHALTATHGMVDRVHVCTADRWPDTFPAIASSLTDADVFIVGVADLTDRGWHAIGK